MKRSIALLTIPIILAVHGLASIASVTSACALSRDAVNVNPMNVDTTGSNLAVVAVAFDAAKLTSLDPRVPVITDCAWDSSAGACTPGTTNVYTPIPAYVASSKWPYTLQLFYSFNPASTGSGRRVTVQAPYQPSVCAWWFSGLTTGLDVYSGAGYDGTSIGGPINGIATVLTPSANGELIITAVNQGLTACDNSMAIISSPSFTGTEQFAATSVWVPGNGPPIPATTCMPTLYFPYGPSFGSAMAYMIQATAAPIYPTWSWTLTSDVAVAAIVAFK